MRERYTAKQVAEAIKNAGGFVTVAAKHLGCERITVYQYINRYVTVKQALEDARDATKDMVEGKLIERIQGGDITAIIFYLKTQARDRGYSERVEVSGPDGKSLEIEVKSYAIISPEDWPDDEN